MLLKYQKTIYVNNKLMVFIKTLILVSLLFKKMKAKINALSMEAKASAVIIGALIFDEKPDLLSVAGLAIIAGSGLLTVVRERIRLGAVKWNPFGRNRL